LASGFCALQPKLSQTQYGLVAQSAERSPEK
jgi:hypothetical protein